MKKIYAYMTLEQKKEAMTELKSDRLKLQAEVDRHLDGYPAIVREVLLHTLDSWALEIAQLEDDISNEHH